MKHLSMIFIYPFLLFNDIHISMSTDMPLEDLRKQSKKTMKMYMQRKEG